MYCMVLNNIYIFALSNTNKNKILQWEQKTHKRK